MEHVFFLDCNRSWNVKRIHWPSNAPVNNFIGRVPAQSKSGCSYDFIRRIISSVVKDERKTRVLATTARTFLCVVREQSEPVFINRSKPLFFFFPSFICLYLWRTSTLERKEKRKRKQSRKLGLWIQWKPQLWMTWVRQTIDWLFYFEEKVVFKQILLRRHWFCYCLSRAAWGKIRSGRLERESCSCCERSWE